MDGGCRPFDDTPHAMFIQAVCTCLQDLVSNYATTAPSPPPSGIAEPQPTGAVSFQAGTGCEHSWKQAPEGKTGDALKSKDQGHGLGSHESGGYMRPVLHTRCSSCHDVTDAPTPQNTLHSRNTEGDDPEGALHRPPQVPLLVPHPMSDLHRAVLGVHIPEGDNPGGDLHTYMEANDCSSPSWVTSQCILDADHPNASTGCPAASSHAQGGTQTQSVSVAVLVGGLEWLVGPQGTSPNIPPPTSRGPTTGQQFSIDGPYGPLIHIRSPREGSSTGSPSWVAPRSNAQASPMGDSSVAEDSFCILQQVPLATGSTPPGYTGPTQESPASSLNCLQPLISVQETPGPSSGTSPTLPCSQGGGSTPRLGCFTGQCHHGHRDNGWTGVGWAS